MVQHDPLVTRYDIVGDVGGELTAIGLAEPEEIGRGGFGVVYRCRQQALDRPVAVKVLTAGLDAENLERFMREQRAMGRLSGHPNIVNILQIGTTSSGRPFIIMQYHPHGTLDSLISKRGPLDWSATLRLGIKIAGALETAHSAGILHRDVKPANILFTEYGEPALTDFGIARMSGSFETCADMVAGTPAFTAPEVLEGAPPTVASDIYGLGATLFCALTAHAAFERKSGESVVAQFLRVSSKPVLDLEKIKIPDALSDAVERAMARDPADRPTSVGEFGKELAGIGHQLGFGADEMALRVDAAEASLLAGSGAHATGSDLRSSGTIRRTSGSRATVAPTPATKFRRPRRQGAQVFRQRLIDALRARGSRRLTVIHGPAGYGKTTLVAQWGEELAGEGVNVAWLNIDDNDNNLVWFLANLVEAIRRANSEVADDLPAVIEERGENAERYVLTSLINDITDSDEPTAVIIDDWHRISSDAVMGAMNFLLEHGGDSLQFVVATRHRSGLPLSRMRVRNELTEIDVSALCFDAAEAQSFMVDVAGLELSSDDVTQLRDSTEGWVAGLQLASLSLRGADNRAEVISHISGRHHAIADFLTENVLSALEPEMLHFLLMTAITDRICGSLASALSGEPRAQAMLEEVESRDLFLRRTDDSGDWFRYAHLFAEFLRRRLDRDHPEKTTELHRKASEWFGSHHMLVEAVDHALAAGDTARAIQLVEADGPSLIEHSQMAKLLGLVDKLPSAAVQANPTLQVALAWVHVVLHRPEAAHAELERVHAILPTLQGPEAADLCAQAGVAEASLRAHADRTDGIDDLVSDALSRPERLRPFVVSVAANLKSYTETYRFDFDAAHHWQEWARPYHAKTNGPYTVMYGYARDAIAAFEGLDLKRTEQCLRAAWQAACGAGAVHSQAARFAGSLLAELHYERGEIAEAQRLLDESLKLRPEEGIVEFIIARLVVAARLAVLRGDHTAAADLLDNGAGVAQQLSTRRLRAGIENERVILGLPTRRAIGSPIEFAQRQRADDEVDGIAEITAQLEEDTAIRLLLTSGAGEQDDVACRWAQEWVDRLQGRGRHRALLRAQRTLALCLAAAGRTGEAKRLLGSILARCAELGMVRFPVDGGQGLIALIQQIRDDQQRGKADPTIPQVPMSFLDRILDEADAHGSNGPAGESSKPTV